jgi:hypothetical protein
VRRGEHAWAFSLGMDGNETEGGGKLVSPAAKQKNYLTRYHGNAERAAVPSPRLRVSA